MDSITAAVMADRARGWDWVRSELTRVRDEARAEAVRLLGPDRGE